MLGGLPKFEDAEDILPLFTGLVLGNGVCELAESMEMFVVGPPGILYEPDNTGAAWYWGW